MVKMTSMSPRVHLDSLNCAGYRVVHITSSGTAARDGRLALGDELVNISGKRLRGLPKEKAASIIAEAGRNADCVVARTSPQPKLPTSLVEIVAMFPSRQIINLSSLNVGSSEVVGPTVICVGGEEEEEEEEEGGEETVPVYPVT